MNNWTPWIDSLLDKIRLSYIQLTNRHIKKHLYYKGASAYFEIPTIILSVLVEVLVLDVILFLIKNISQL